MTKPEAGRTPDPFAVHDDFVVGGRKAGRMVSLRRFEASGAGDVSRLPVSLRIILESVLRNLGHPAVAESHVRSLARWQPRAARQEEVPFIVARVLLQDIAGLPVLADLSAMRSAMVRRGADATTVQPEVPVELVIDHSIQVDRAGTPTAFDFNSRLEFQRNGERYAFLTWAAQAFRNLRVLPPGAGIIHQIHMEHLARGVIERDGLWFPDTLVGTDSHTTMVNGLGVLGWGVGGIEATAAMLAEPVPLLLPDVIGVRLDGALKEGVTATSLVLTLTEMLRREKVVGKFIEFYGDGARHLSVPDRATIANMAPEYGATLAYFAADQKTLEYYALTGRSARSVALCAAYLKQQGLFGLHDTAPCDYTREIVLDLRDVEPSVSGPSRPQQRVRLADAGAAFRDLVRRAPAGAGDETRPGLVRDGDILIAAITSCTNTSNPQLMVAAGLLAQKAVQRGLRVPAHVKTSFAPGSRAVASYLERAGLREPMEALGFHVVGFGCTTCMGNSGPLSPELEDALCRSDVAAVSVLSGNRNFEARVHTKIRANFLMSPPLVVAYALAGSIGVDLVAEPIGYDEAGAPVRLQDLWPTPDEIAASMTAAQDPELYRGIYGALDEISPLWTALDAPAGATFEADPDSTYIKSPPFFETMPAPSSGARQMENARALAILGDSITTDHISPVGRIAPDSPAGQYLQAAGVRPADFNTYAARRGNHDVMMRGIFSNPRLRNRMVEREGGFTRHYGAGEVMTIYDAAMAYRAGGVATLVFAGDEYGSGSSRDWAAKGLHLLGVKAVIAEGFERIHRSNLVGMAVLPCQLPGSVRLPDLALLGDETFDLVLSETLEPRQEARLVVRRQSGTVEDWPVTVRVDTPIEVEYLRHGGILPYLMRRRMERADEAA